MVIFSETAHELQEMLNTLHVYTYTFVLCLTVNVQKTKTVIFRHRVKIHNNERWHQLRLRIALHILAFCYV